MSDPYTSFSSKLYGWLSIAERALLVGAVIGLAMKTFNMKEPGDSVVMISLSGLAGVFFLSAFRPPAVQAGTKEKKLGFMDLLFTAILPKITGISCAVGTIGVLFALLHKPGAKEMMQVGLAATGAASALIAIGLAQGNEQAKALSPFLNRLLPLMGICVYYLFHCCPANSQIHKKVSISH